MDRRKGGPSPSELLKLLDVKEKNKEDERTMEKTKSDENIISSKVNGNVIKLKTKDGKNSISEPKTLNLKILSTNEVFYDAALSFRFSLNTGIFMEDGPLSGEKSLALKDWVTLIHRTWPSKEDMNTYSLTKEILVNFDDVVKDEANLKRIVSKYYEKDADWSASCKKGTSYLGFTCGLWQLFHITMVGVVQWNKHAPTSDIITSVHASDTLRNFIANFFACSVCQKHFLQMYDSCSFNRCRRLNEDTSTDHANWKELSLWLWEMHNDVNVRLKEEGAEREKRSLTDSEKSAARWPSDKECQLCRRDETEWDNETVYRFIMNHYWPGETKNFQRKPFISNVNEISTNSSEKAGNGRTLLGIFFLVATLLYYLYWFWFATWRKIVSGRRKKI